MHAEERPAAPLSAGLFAAALQAAAELLRADPNDLNLTRLLEIGRTAGPQESLRLAVPIWAGQPAPVRQRWGLAFAAYEREALDNAPAALRRLESLYAADPEDGPTFEALVAALDEVTPRRAAQLLGQRAEREDPQAAAPFALRAAAQWAERLGEPATGATVLMALLERSPEQDGLRGAAARYLAASGQTAALMAFLWQGVARLEGPERAQAYLQLARVQERSGDPEGAVATLEAGLRAVANDPILTEALLARYEGAGRWAEFSELALSYADRLPRGDTRNRLAAKAALILEGQLREPSVAAPLLARLVADGARGGVLEALERCYRELQDWSALLTTISLRTHAARSGAKADAFADRAALYAAQGQTAEAEADLRHALEAQADHPLALDLVGDVEAGRGDLESAAGRWVQLVPQLDGPARAEVLVKLGRAEVQLKHPAEGKAAFDQAMQADPTRVDAVLGRLELAEADGDASLAHDLASAAAALSSGRQAADCWRRAGVAAEQLSQDKAAVDAYRAALDANPADAVAEASLARVYAAQQQLEPALRHFSGAAERTADDPRAAALFLDGARTAQALGRPEQASALAERALALIPLHRDVLEWLSDCEANQLHWEAAFELGATLLLHYEPALSRPKRAEVYLRLSQAKLHQGELELAEGFARSASEAAPEAPEPWLRLAGIYQQRNQLAEAVTALERVAERAEDKLARDALMRAAALQLGLSDGAASRTEVRLLTLAQRKAPDDVQVAERLMQAYLRFSDRAQAAEAVARTARKLKPAERAELLYLSARLLSLVGPERLQAKSLLQEASQIAPELSSISDDLQVLHATDGEWEAVVELRAKITHPPERVRQARLQNRDLLRFVLKDPTRALVVSRQLLAEDSATADDVEVQAELLEQLALSPGGASLLPEAIHAWATQLALHPGDPKVLASIAGLCADGRQDYLHRMAVELAQELGSPLSFSPPEASPEPLPVGALFVSPQESAPDLQLLDAVGYALWAAVEAELPESLRPRRGDRLKAWVMNEALEAAAASMGLAVPPVFSRDDALRPVQPTISGKAGLVISQQLCQQLTPAELRHHLAAGLSYLRPRAISLVSLPMSLLREALIGLARPEDYGPYGVQPRAARRRGKAVERALPSAERAPAIELAQAWLTDPNRRSLSEARRAVQETAARAGLLASGSLAVSCKLEAQRASKDPMVSPMSLCRFACHQDYLDAVFSATRGRAPTR